MRVVHTIPALRAALRAPRAEGRRIGLVPTMGAFHEGHLALMRAARERCDVVVVSLFVNPRQFEDAGDLDAYPRTLDTDAALASEQGVDVLWAPATEVVYPEGFATEVRVRGLTEPLEGAHRGPGHFDGVTTVVAKLFNQVGPDVAFFGQKDAQQAAVIARMARDLDFPVDVDVLPTVRDEDGLALSSRNARLSPEQRLQAPALKRALDAAAEALAAGAAPADAAERGAALLRDAGLEPEYLQIVSPTSLGAPNGADQEVLIAVAARVGEVRLIDNVLLPRTPLGGS